MFFSESFRRKNAHLCCLPSHLHTALPKKGNTLMDSHNPFSLIRSNYKYCSINEQFNRASEISLNAELDSMFLLRFKRKTTENSKHWTVTCCACFMSQSGFTVLLAKPRRKKKKKKWFSSKSHVLKCNIGLRMKR